MAAQNLANTKAEIFSNLVQKELLEKSNLVPFVSDYSNLAIKGVKDVSIPKLNSFSVQTRAFGAAATENAALTDSVDTISIDKNKIVLWGYDAKDAVQSSINYQMEAAKRAASAHGRDVNQVIITEWETVAGLNINGASAADITADNILDMRKFLMQNHADMNQVYFIIAADQEKEMLLLPEFSRYEYRGASPSPIVNGLIGSVYGIPVVISQAVKAQQAFMVEKTGSGIAFQVGAQYAEESALEYGSNGKRAVVDQLYGFNGLQLGEGVALDNSTPLGATVSPLIAKLAD
jgi:hypothetical protein